MLVITRRRGEGFWIGDEIYVKLLPGHGSQQKVGITAPPEMVILRDVLKPHDEDTIQTESEGAS